jgi:hypothetical protein
MINGKFRTPKIIYLHKAIDRINLKYNMKIDKLPLYKGDLDSNPWLAGMTDADGTFVISLAGKYARNDSLELGRAKCIYSIRQRIIDQPTGESCVPFMSEIADLFKCNITYVGGRNILGFLAQTNNKHFLTKSYFDKYPLMTSKYLDYLSFLEGINYLGRSLNSKEIMEIQELKNSMNNKRIYYT